MARTDERYVGSTDQLVYVSSSTMLDGLQAGGRVIDVHPLGGLHCRVLVDRGLDIGPAWVDGQPLDWRSPIGFPASARAAGRPWLEAFGGGLMVTCGPDNVGPDCEDDGLPYGLHGSHSSTPASDVRVDVAPDRSSIDVVGTIRHAAVFGPNVLVRRTITFSIGSARLRVRDVITNEGCRPEPLMLLYHLNFGFPLVSPESVLRIASSSVVPRDDVSASALDAWDTFAEPDVNAPSQVFEHCFDSTVTQAHALLANQTYAASGGIAARISVDRREMTRLWHWRSMAPDVYLTGIEPANCGVGGRQQERAAGSVDELLPGECREFGFSLEATTGAEGVAAMVSAHSQED